jgi:Mechanosensitive ion channel, conserved TM helix
METRVQDQVTGLADNIIAYLPNLLAGIVLTIIGLIAGWLIKRVLVQISILLRIDRFLRRSRWEADFAKADVRYGLYNIIGNVGFTLIFLLFLDNALIAWKLTMLSDLLSKVILYLPQIMIAIAIFGLGWLIAFWVQRSILKSLYKENIPRASLISRFVKIILMIFFSAIAFVELDIAREIVIIGFSTIFITLGLMSVVITAIGGKQFIGKISESFEEKKN